VIFDRVAALPVLGHDALQVAFADQLKEAFALTFDVIHVEQERGVCRHNLAQDALPFDQRSIAQVLTVEVQQVRGAKAWRTTAE